MCVGVHENGQVSSYSFRLPDVSAGKGLTRRIISNLRVGVDTVFRGRPSHI